MNKALTTFAIIAIVAIGVWLLLRDKSEDAVVPMTQSHIETIPNDTMYTDTTVSEISSAGNMPGDMDITTDQTVATGTTGTTTKTPTTTSKTQSFTVEASNFNFAPTTMTVNKGDTVRITLKNTQGKHDLKVDVYNVKTKLLSVGSEDTIEFVADKTGTFEYYCTVGSHRAMGMKGMLTVK